MSDSPGEAYTSPPGKKLVSCAWRIDQSTPLPEEGLLLLLILRREKGDLYGDTVILIDHAMVARSPNPLSFCFTVLFTRLTHVSFPRLEARVT